MRVGLLIGQEKPYAGCWRISAHSSNSSLLIGRRVWQGTSPFPSEASIKNTTGKTHRTRLRRGGGVSGSSPEFDFFAARTCKEPINTPSVGSQTEWRSPRTLLCIRRQTCSLHMCTEHKCRHMCRHFLGSEIVGCKRIIPSWSQDICDVASTTVEFSKCLCRQWARNRKTVLMARRRTSHKKKMETRS